MTFFSTIWKTGMMKALGMAASLASVAVAAQPYQNFYNEAATYDQGTITTSTIDIDFSKSSSAYPSRNFPTWNSPLSNGVEYFDINYLKDNSSGCYEVSSSGSTSDDVALFFNYSGTWQTLSDDHGGNRQFRARIAVLAHEEHFLRVSPYSTSYTNAGITFTIKKVNADPWVYNGTSSNSCGVSGIPYYRRGFNNDYPYYP